MTRWCKAWRRRSGSRRRSPAMIPVGDSRWLRGPQARRGRVREVRRRSERVAPYSGVDAGLPKVVFYTIWNQPHQSTSSADAPGARRIPQARGCGDPRAARQGGARRKVFCSAEGFSQRRGRPRAGDVHEQRFRLDKTWKPLRGAAARRLGCSKFKKVDADGFAHHPYGPIEIVLKKCYIINLLAIRRLWEGARPGRQGKRILLHLPIYNTEFGIQNNPPAYSSRQSRAAGGHHQRRRRSSPTGIRA